MFRQLVMGLHTIFTHPCSTRFQQVWTCRPWLHVTHRNAVLVKLGGYSWGTKTVKPGGFTWGPFRSNPITLERWSQTVRHSEAFCIPKLEAFCTPKLEALCIPKLVYHKRGPLYVLPLTQHQGRYLVVCQHQASSKFQNLQMATLAAVTLEILEAKESDMRKPFA